MLGIENVSRRNVLQGLVAGTGALVLGGKLLAPSRALAVPELGTPLAPNVFVAIANDGAVTLTAHRSEMGQGSCGGAVRLAWGKAVWQVAEHEDNA